MLNNLTLQKAIEIFYMYGDRVLLNDGGLSVSRRSLRSIRRIRSGSDL